MTDASIEGNSPLFSTVLMARMPNTAPSDLERHIRNHCQRLRIVERLSGGAHLVLPSESTIAVRVYNPSDLEKLNKKEDCMAKIEAWNRGSIISDDDPENLAAFRDSFQFPFVFFLLPSMQSISENLDHTGSFFHQAQNIMNRWNPTNSPKSTTLGRTFVVPDAASIVKILVQISVNLKPEKRALKDKYVERMKTKFFLPDPVTGIPPSIEAAVHHVRHEFLRWAETYELPPGEAEVLIAHLGTLGAIASASHVILENVPVEDETKQLFHHFFGSEARPPPPMQHEPIKSEHPFESYEDSVIDDYDFLSPLESVPNVPSQIYCIPHHLPMHSDRYFIANGMYQQPPAQYPLQHDFQNRLHRSSFPNSMSQPMRYGQPGMTYPHAQTQATNYQHVETPSSAGKAQYNGQYSSLAANARPRFH